MTLLIMGNLLFWAAAIGGLAALLDPGTRLVPASPEEKALFERFSREEIDDDEYRSLREELRSTAGNVAGA